MARIDDDLKLYRITNRLGTFYVVAKSFDEAANALLERLDKADYGFLSYREVPSVEHIASQHFFPEDKQSFSNDEANLIIV